MTTEIKDELSSIKSNITFKKTKANTNKTPHGNKFNILEKNINNLECFLNSKMINIYQRPWKQLESKLKKDKVKEYFDKLLENNTISKEEYNKNIEKYNKLIDLQKKINCCYDVDECIITNIKD